MGCCQMSLQGLSGGRRIILMNVWEQAILKIVLSLNGRASLQQVYRILEQGTILQLTNHDIRETRWQGRPAYQHQVRSHISNLTQFGDLVRVGRGAYEITEKGRKRIRL
jgi:hypothetical protein